MKKVLIAAIAALMSTSAHAAVGDYFSGANGGIRYIDAQTLNDDGSTSFTIRTVRANGTVKVREFTVSANGDVSGNSKGGFKDWLRAQAAPVSFDAPLTNNEIAYNAWAESVGSTDPYTADAAAFDWVGIAERIGIEVEYNQEQSIVLGTPDFTSVDETHQMILDTTGDISVRLKIDPTQRNYVLDNGRWVPNFYTIDGQEALYELTNVRGLEEVHQQGWTGKGVTVQVVDAQGERSHGHYVADAVLAVAPGATIPHYEQKGFHRIYDGADIVNISSGRYLSSNGRLKGNGTTTIEQLAQSYAGSGNNEQLFVTTHPNSNRCDYGDHNAANCSGRVAAHDRGLLEGSWIFVRAEDKYYTSHDAGESDIKNHTLTASGKSPSAWGGVGTSFAAPRVSGAAALVMHKFPEVNAAQTKSILLESAYNEFEGYTLEKYGRGILDVGAALSPIGGLN